MNIQCPNCETIFDLQTKQKIPSKYKCSVCNHVWLATQDKPKQTNSAEKANFKIILILNITIFLIVILVFLEDQIWSHNLDTVYSYILLL